MTIYNRDLAKRYIEASFVITDGVTYDVSDLDYYSILRAIDEDLGEGSAEILLQEITKDIINESHEEALTMNEMIAKDPTISDEWDEFDTMLAQQDLGDVDPSAYQKDDGNSSCEGGGCVI